MKTTNDILSFVYKKIKASPIDSLDGGIYKATRQTDSKLNDCVISLIPGNVGKFLQNGALYVKIFYKDLFINNTYSEDFAVSSQMQTLLFNLSTELLKNTTYSFDIQSRDIHTQAVEETNEHYAVLIINFKY